MGLMKRMNAEIRVPIGKIVALRDPTLAGLSHHEIIKVPPAMGPEAPMAGALPWVSRRAPVDQAVVTGGRIMHS